VVFLGGPADRVHRSYPYLDVALPQLFLFDYYTGNPDRPTGASTTIPAPMGWRYQLLDPPGIARSR
jgi:hypothetical protein